MSLCLLAKDGDERAARTLKSIGLRVWTRQELNGLNFLLENKKLFTYIKEMDKLYTAGASSLVWVARVSEDYFLVCRDDLSQWVASLNGDGLRLLFDVEKWVKYEILEKEDV